MGRHSRPARWLRRLLRTAGVTSMVGVVGGSVASSAPAVLATSSAPPDPGPSTITMPLPLTALAVTPIAPEAATEVLVPPASAAAVTATTGAAVAAAHDEADRQAHRVAEQQAAERATATRDAARKTAQTSATRPGSTTRPSSTPQLVPSSSTPRVAPSSSAPVSGALGTRIVAAARGYVGAHIPYVYGGKTLAGMDCSALVWFVLRDAGLSVGYRSSAALAGWAARVSTPQPGDLVLYPGHVGIYVGGGMMIDHGGPGAGANLRRVWGSPVYGRVPA